MSYFNQGRRDYTGAPLSEADLLADPIEQFRLWLELAREAESFDVAACTLCTATSDGRPSGRVVLVKEANHAGLAFFTNYESRKAHELDRNPAAALVFYWPTMHRQVTVEGTVARVSPAESDDYFATRPRGAQLGAWASPQSQIITRESLEQRTADAEARFDAEVPRPEHWGGYRLLPAAMTFWQGRPNRLHDRFRYERQADGGWRVARLAP